ncbi:MAG: multidrug transporter AcrB [Bdellovibrionales bacterium RIFOXYC1_FULL_54_43]|nr:MAG: multidrug transporter AcrB [Bdellovibrionales bacterium RIFOXYC1_FULL_54_43]OFZ84340.1 MAG: multidrug transporter AcrB [Bdellovibrionales bacterium RIFOXYD1_FULL_55_31]
MSDHKTGFAGRTAQAFIRSKLTPVIVMASIITGIGAVWLTPKEEEPQISVPMIDIQTMAPGFNEREVERKVSEPIERAVWGLEGVEYVYSASMPNFSLITVRFKVGEPMEPSLVKVHHKLMSIRQDLPPSVQQPSVNSFSIDDVPFLTLTFSSESRNDHSLRTLVAPLARELSSTPDLSRVELLGGRKRAIRIIVDPDRLSTSGVTLPELAQSLKANQALGPAGKNWSDQAVYDVEVGGKTTSSRDIGMVVVAQKGGSIIRVKDVAQVIDGPEERTRASILVDKSGVQKAVSIVFAKRKGTNIVNLAEEILHRAEVFSKKLPADVKLSVLRNMGATAEEKSNELIEHLLLATLSVSILIALFMGLRAALVVAIAIPVTLALSLAIYYFMGYTLNRVTLFALIFSIGILVDDAIVVVENIERHLKLDKQSGLIRTTIKAVSEVGNPTILATFTVIAAVLPMAFVRGLMGPYMKPIPVGASLAMIVSLLVAFVVTPWASIRLLKHAAHKPAPGETARDRLYRKFVDKLLSRKRNSILFGAMTLVLLLLSASLLYFKAVKVKMLPFDNKDEFQVLLDYPPTTPLAKSSEASVALARKLLRDPDVERIQVFAGEPAPFSFSGMVKHTFLRKSDYLNDLQVKLTRKSHRKRSSHEIISQLRGEIADFSRSNNVVSKVLEIPPGPPVLATLVAEVYGPSEQERTRVANEILGIFASEPSVVDLDSTLRTGRPRTFYQYDQIRGGLLGTKAFQALSTAQFIFSETPLTSFDDPSSPEEVTLNLSVDNTARSGQEPFKGQNLPSFESGIVPLAKTLSPSATLETRTLHRKNLKPVSYVMSELTGEEEAPVYGILKLAPKIPYKTQTANVPWNTQTPVIKWDGEWFITYEVFRDLGGAFAVVMVLIYVLVLGWFRSFMVPLVIMAPIPISLIGILPGHAMLGAFFSATSMIGFIAGAGIIVRNSIILVDFIELQLKQGTSLKEAVISAGVLRFRPMLLTAAAVVVGSSVMLADPIFSGLAISLMFGEVAATALSFFAVPLLYYWIVGRSRVRFIQTAEGGDF